jgi:Zn-dependent metalloprotease
MVQLATNAFADFLDYSESLDDQEVEGLLKYVHYGYRYNHGYTSKRQFLYKDGKAPHE